MWIFNMSAWKNTCQFTRSRKENGCSRCICFKNETSSLCHKIFGRGMIWWGGTYVNLWMLIISASTICIIQTTLLNSSQQIEKEKSEKTSKNHSRYTLTSNYGKTFIIIIIIFPYLNLTDSVDLSTLHRFTRRWLWWVSVQKSMLNTDLQTSNWMK